MSHETADRSWKVDASLRFTTAAPMRAEILGSTTSGGIGRSLLDGMVSEDVERIVRILGEAAALGRPVARIAARYRAEAGHSVILEMSATPFFGGAGALSGYSGSDLDITSSGRLALAEEPLFLESIYATAPVAICIVGRDLRLLSVNNKHAEMVGKPISELVGYSVDDLSPQGGENVRRDFGVFDGGGTVPDHDFEHNGKVIRVSVAPFRNAQGVVSAISVAFLDITELRRVEREFTAVNAHLNDLALRDHLTGLFNRRHFEERLEMEFRRVQRAGGSISVAMIDVDHFKFYNDLYGHPAGDDCLTKVAKAASQALLRPGDVLFRYGGEEFVAILGETGEEGALLACERMRESVAGLRLPHARSSFGHVSVSIGVATLTSTAAAEAGARESLVSAADRALYAAKSKGRNQVSAASDGAASSKPAQQQVPGRLVP